MARNATTHHSTIAKNRRAESGSVRRGWLIATTFVVITTFILPLEAAGDSPSEVSLNSSSDRSSQPKWLSDLPEQDVHVGYGQFGKNGRAGFLDVPIALNGVESPHGLGMHPPKGTATYRLDKRYRTFRATVAMNDSSPQGPRSPIYFQVMADGKTLWESRGIRGPRNWQPVYLDISGAEQLTLSVDVHPGTGTDSAWAHAVWLDPYVSEVAPDPELLKLLAAQHYAEFDELIDFRQHVRQLFKDEKYAELEGIAKDTRAKRGFSIGSPRLWWFYSVLYQPFANTEASRLEHIDRAGDWQKAFPDSVIPRVIAAESWISFGFAARGTGGSNTVTAEGWKTFEQRLAKAREVLDGAQDLEPKDPEFYRMLISLGQDQELPRQQVDPLLEKIVRLDETYYPAYVTMANYLLPRWNGEEGDERKLAEHLRQEIGGVAGQIAYANVAIHYASFDGIGVLPTRFPYRDLKLAFDAECEAFPTLAEHVEKAAWLASVSDDRGQARKLFERFPPQVWHSTTWDDRETMLHCRRWAAADPSHTEEIATLHGNGTVPLRLAVSPDGKTVATGGYLGDLCFWDLSKGTITDATRVSGRVNVLAFDPKNPRLVLSCGDAQGSLLLCDLESGNQRLTPVKGHDGVVFDAAWTVDGKRFATASTDKTVRIWEADDPSRSISIPHPSEVWSVSFSPDGSKLCTATERGGIYLWDGSTGKSLGPPLTEERPYRIFPLVRFFPDGDRIVMVDQGGPLQIWDLKTRKPRDATTGKSVIWCAALSPNGGWLALGRDNGAVELYDASGMQRVHTFEGHWAKVTGLVFQPDGQSLISASHDMTLKVWDTRRWTSMASPDGLKR